MKNKNLYFYLTAYLALLIPAPGRFVYGFTLMMELFLLSFVAIFSIIFVQKIKFEQLKSIIFILIIISFTILFRQLMIFINAEVVLTLGFLLYLPPVSLLILNILFTQKQEDFLPQFKHNVIKTTIFTFGGMIIFLIRDIFGYGTFTFFGKNHFIYEKVLFNANDIGIFSLLATIPGVLLLIGLLYFIYIKISNKFDIIKLKEE